MKKKDKLLAEWFWTDRWMGSSGFLLPLEVRGLYREMLTQAWRRGARLPNDHAAIRVACGVTAAEWRRCWPKVEKFWRVDGDGLVNDTQLEVYAEAKALQAENQERAKAGAAARWAKRKDSSSNARAHAQASLGQCAPSPSLSPNEQTTTPPNPLVTDRLSLERECLSLTREVAAVRNADPVEVMAEASEWKGSRGNMNPAAMTEGRLLNVVLNLRRMRDGRSKESASPKAQHRMSRLEALATGRVPGAGERVGVEAGDGGAGGGLPGAGRGAIGDSPARLGLPAGAPAEPDGPPVAARRE